MATNVLEAVVEGLYGHYLPRQLLTLFHPLSIVNQQSEKL